MVRDASQQRDETNGVRDGKVGQPPELVPVLDRFRAIDMSSASLRLLLVDSNDEIFRLPQARFERMLCCPLHETLPEFAGQRVRAAEVVVQLENRSPVYVGRVIYHYLHFGQKGELDYDRYMRDGVTVMEAGSPHLNLKPHDPKVIEAAQRFAARRRDHSVWWRPSLELEEAIIQAALGHRQCRRL